MSDFGTNPTFKNVDVNGDLNVDGDLTLTDVTLTGDLTVSGTVDGRDISADGTKLDGIEAGATTDQTASEIRALVESATDSNVFTDADHTKLNGIEAGANITDTANVTSAGALMDSEVTNLSQVKSFDSSDYATAAQGTKADNALPKAGGTMTGHLSFGDNDKAIFGAGSDLQIYHDGSDSHIKDAGTGGLIIKGESSVQIRTRTANEAMLYLSQDGAVQAFYDGSLKLATTSTGIDVTGTVNATAFTGDGSGLTNLPPGTAIGGNTGVSFNDNVKVNFGTSDDLQIYHDGSNSYIQESGTGNLFIRADNLILADGNGTQFLRGTANSDVKIYHNSIEKLATTATGVNVTGQIGIGTDNPDTLIHGAADGGATLTLENTDTTLEANDLIGGIDFKGNDASEDGNEVLAYVRANSQDTTPDSYLTFGTLSNTGGVDDTVQERMRIDSSGQVGIGTDNPSFPLDISGSDFVGIHYERSSTSSPALRLSNATTGSLVQIEGSNAGDFIFKNGAGTVAEAMRIDSDGRVGIGTSSPAARLSFGGYVPSNGQTIHTYQSGNIVSGLGIVSGVHRMFTDSGSALSYGHVSVSDGSTYTEAMQIDSSGNLHVGGTSESGTSQVTLNGSGYIKARKDNVTGIFDRISTDGDILEFRKDGTTVGSIGVSNDRLQITSQDEIQLGVFGTPRVRIFSSLMRPETDNQYDLGISTSRFKDLHLSGTAYSGQILIGATAQIGTGSNLIKADGDTLALDVYTSTDTAGRDVFAVRSNIGGDETKVGVIEANGDFQSATNSYGSISDQSVKQDIVDANSQMEDVKNIRLRNYRLIDHVTAYGDDAKVHLGVVAQELEAENMNGLVSENADGVKGVRYSVMLLKALGALQETITMVEDLQAENIQIKARLTALEG